MKKVLCVSVLFLLCAFCFCSCGKSDKETIIGQWTAEDGTSFEFFSDGTAFSGAENKSYDYILEDGRIKFQDSWGQSAVYDYELSKDTLEFQFPDGSTLICSRAAE